ncbi:amidohydrolase [Anoxynatronum sibiricum]|uniref:Amidohydrolase n=1 Tax=Anoxynatronum sibiricum TaxID=210623 RepID=A0ABU9VX60_9CLOT
MKTAATLLIVGNAIYDSVRHQPFPGVLVIEGNRIVDVGDMSLIERYTGTMTKLLDAGNRLVMPGFHDSHTHLLMAGMYQSCVNLSSATSEKEAALMVKEAAQPLDDSSGWVIGFSWYHVFWDDQTPPTKASLDAYFPDRPVFLLNAEAHGAWVNSKALEIAGIDAATPNPFGGEICRDERGEATGLLLESATGLITRHAFAFSTQEEKAYLQAYEKSALANGITSVNDVQPYFHGNMGTLEVYHDMDKQGDWNLRVHVALDLLGDLSEAETWRQRVHSDGLRVDHLKQFLDGVITTHTALVLEPYADASDTCGISLMDTLAIEKAVPEAHKRGFSLKLHACGDRAVRMGLDYIEAAEKQYGKNQCRHAIEHIEMVSDEDVPRFATLGVIPSVQPEHIALTQRFADSPYFNALGEDRANKTWPLKTLYDTVGLLAIGSDCPVVDNNPFLEIYRGVTRKYNDGEPKEGWNPSEKLSLHEVLRSYTYGSAYGVGREHELGTLEPGKLADVIILDRNLFDVSTEEIRQTKVDTTIFNGQVVYQRPSTDQ